MKQFNLEEYLRLKEEGKEPPIVTRNGCSARIICTDRKNDHLPIIALVAEGDMEFLESVNEYGRYTDNPEYDLLFAPTKHEGWVNVYKNATGLCARKIYATEDEAKANASADSIATAKIEWEE